MKNYTFNDTGSFFKGDEAEHLMLCRITSYVINPKIVCYLPEDSMFCIRKFIHYK